MKTMKIETSCGDRFEKVSNKAKSLATTHTCNVEFEFNEVKCVVNESTDEKLLYRDYCNAHMMEWRQVGPDCKKAYPKIIKDELKKREKAAEERRNRQQAEYEAKMQERRNAIPDIPVEITDQEAYDSWKKKNKDGYGKAVFVYAENWAKLMQAQIRKGRSIFECAEKTSYEADTEGITGFQHGYAVAILSQCWKHGEALKQWHNNSYGYSGDGVVNPAVLTTS